MVFHILRSWFHIHTFVSPDRFLSGIQWDIGSLSSSKVQLISDGLSGGPGQHGGHLVRAFRVVLSEMQLLKARSSLLSQSIRMGVGGWGWGETACRFKYH